MHLRITFTLPIVLLTYLLSVSAHPDDSLHSLAHRDIAHAGSVVKPYDAGTYLQRREEYVALFARAKITAAQQAARKQAVKDKVTANQASNKAKKESLQETKKANPNAEPNKKGRKAPSPKPGKPSPPGWRANARTKGNILPKEPKTPKPNAVKGAAKTEKALKTQQAANDKTAARKAAGRAKFGDAAAAQRATTGLPPRKGTYNVGKGKSAVSSSAKGFSHHI
jgi:hypothetical protein